MSAFDVVQRYGTWALVRCVLGMVAFMVLHLARLPLLMLARVLEICMRRIDAMVVAELPPRRGPVRAGEE